MTTGYQIVSPGLTVQALRDSGYKSTAHALAELIDNGIEADASAVEVFAVEEWGLVTERARHRIEYVGVLDDGHGMESTVLRRALRFGDGTRQQRNGMGRFGMGLPNSSMSQCKRVDVWSWTTGPDNALHTYLDLEAIRNGMDEVPEPFHDPVPKWWQGLSQELSSSGTLVVWSSLDRVQWRGALTTLKNTASLIGRIYRRFLDKGSVRIRLVPVRGNEATGEAFDARPNDPMYLMAPSMTPPPFREQPMFEPTGASSTGQIGVEEFQIPSDLDGESHTVRVRVSRARDVARRSDLDNSPWPQQYRGRQPGNTPWGQHAGRNMGISLVRADRELLLDDSWVNDYDPVERWWGIEIEFPPALDEVFGVTNDKQAVTTFTSLAHFDWKREAEPGETYRQFVQRLADEGDTRQPLIELVYHLREKLLPHLRNRLEEQTRHTGSSRKRYDPASETANQGTSRRREEGHTGLTDDLADQKSPEESREEQVKNLTRTHRFSREDAERQIEDATATGRTVRMITSHQPANPAFFDVEFFPGMLQAALNMDHPVFQHLIAALEADTEDLDRDELAERIQRASTAFKVLIYSWARFEDEQPTKPRERARDMRWDWGRLAKEFFEDEHDDED